MTYFFIKYLVIIIYPKMEFFVLKKENLSQITINFHYFELNL